MDVVTAVSGSGPAYFLLLIEALEDAAVELGMDRKTARLLAVETARGAGRMAAESPEAPALQRAQVTSKGGTTAAALEVLESAQRACYFCAGGGRGDAPLRRTCARIRRRLDPNRTHGYRTMQALLFILNTLLTLVVVAYLLRVLMPLVRADFRNPIGQAVLTITSPLVVPLRRIVPPSKRASTWRRSWPC